MIVKAVKIDYPLSVPNMTADTIILGAGPAGIGAAIRLGKRALVLERSPEVAGLCRTVVLDDVVFDLGGHSFHTPHAGIRQLVFDTLPMEQQRRDAWCLTARSWIPIHSSSILPHWKM